MSQQDQGKYLPPHRRNKAIRESPHRGVKGTNRDSDYGRTNERQEVKDDKSFTERRDYNKRRDSREDRSSNERRDYGQRSGNNYSYESRRGNEEGEIPKNHRRDFSRGSKFNTRIISSEKEANQKETEPGPGSIEIPDIIIPPVVEPVITESIEKKEDKEMEKGATEKVNPREGLYKHEIRLIRKLEAIREKQAGKEAQREFDQWLEHYGKELQDMYETCVDIGISYNTFVELAYRCTDTEFNGKKFKYTRPLI